MRDDILKYQRIRDLREDRDLPQKILASFLNVAQNTYSQYETGTHSVPLEIMEKLADFHNTSVDYLMGRTDEKTPYPPGSKGLSRKI